MRTMNCRKMRREIEEAGVGDSLRWVVNKHLSTCPVCETFAREQTKLREMVSSLGTIEAPGDFDFRLRARLAADKRQPQPFALAGLSFGLRSAAMAMILILAGGAILFMALQTRKSTPQTVADNLPIAKPANSEIGNVAVVPGTVKVDQSNPVIAGNGAIDQSPDPSPSKRRGLGQTTVASYRDNRANRIATRDMSNTGAMVLKGNETAGSSAFPIEASYQSLKVSVDNGSGGSRTISLPTVSFGSQRALSQGASPLMASARGAW